MTHSCTIPRRKRLIIIGGGFAGAVLARRLERKLSAEWAIYLLSENNYITFSPLLPEVVGASVLPGHAVVPLRHMLKRTIIRMAHVERIDWSTRTVHFHQCEPDSLDFDQLVFAAGVRANLTAVPGMASHALPLKTVGDALHMRNCIISNLEEAVVSADPERRKRLTTFIIIGGGLSGVEVAGELDDFLRAATKYYPGISVSDLHIILIQSGSRLLPELSEKLGTTTARIFRRRNIDILLESRAVEVSAESVQLKDGRMISGATIICTVGTRPHAFIQNNALPLEHGRIATQPDMSIANLPGIWAIGDCARVLNAFSGKHCPPTAQFAVHQAHALADNIIRELQGLETQPFSHKPRGVLASIGHNKAVVELFGVEFSGFIAWLIWRGYYLLKIPTLSRKMRLFLEWNWAMFFPPDIAHLDFTRTQSDKN